MCQSYTFQLMINTGRQHDAGHDSFQQEDDRVDDSGHCGVSGAQAAAAQQTCCSAAETWDLKQRPNVQKRLHRGSGKVAEKQVGGRGALSTKIKLDTKL